MKNIKYIIALVICINNLTLFSQEKDTTQLHYYKLGIKEKDVRVAYNYFRKAYLESENTEIGKNSLVKADSLKLNLRQELLLKIIGVWKSKNDEKSVKNLLVISSESLVIYNCLNHNTQIEKLTFFEPKYYQYYFLLRLSDKKLYSISLNTDDTLSLNIWGIIDKNGKEYMTNHGEELLYSRVK